MLWHARPECTFCFLGTWHLRNTKSLGTVLLCLSQNWSPFHNKTSCLKGNLLCYFCFLFVPPFLVEVSTDSIPNIPYYQNLFFPLECSKIPKLLSILCVTQITWQKIIYCCCVLSSLLKMKIRKSLAPSMRCPFEQDPQTFKSHLKFSIIAK